MLRCLAIDSVVARPVVDGPQPVQFRPLCLFRPTAGTRLGFTAPFQSISFIDWDILNVGRKSASVSYIHKTPSWRTDIGGPRKIRAIDRNVFQKIGIDLVIRPVGRESRPRINRLQPHHPHQPPHPFGIDRMALPSQAGRQPRHAVKRALGEQFVDQPHDGQVIDIYARGQIIKRRARELQKPALPDDRHCHNHFFHFGPLQRDRSVCDFFLATPAPS
jgi:hypothetical protein